MDVSPLCLKVAYKPQMIVETRAFHPTPITTSYITCSVTETPNLIRYEASLGAVLSHSKTSNCGS